MAKKTENTLLFALIEAGALSRQAALAPLRELGLLPGDDAILLWLNGNPETEFSEMMFELGLEKQTLRTVLFRFQNTGLVTCVPTQNTNDLEVSLTEGGQRLIDALEHHWRTLDKQLRAQLQPKKSKKLKKALHKLADSF
ncbi:MarR family winged helix-turn-helix transcriptional regulator [Maritalea porphyrae]|uniref:MarR family winged helix-turn-helix transcriptional regulator n=1 Tax=Maritalea porphyrae TaxID=880732 RepID=UPI0022AE7AF9|nr:MarR family winged helix-turn-helix transcriptional regulator [Maritalea porphyrae]MCZ4273791.1 MarR family winged helix-turn-helix transcriptional regulator [Maritalea porphyrae]